MSNPNQARDHRSLFLSDIHLGHAGARPDLLLGFLLQNRAGVYYLVGDIFDCWQGGGGAGAEQAVVDHLYLRQSQGAQIVYVRGNHDPLTVAGNLGAAVANAIHLAADGRRYLITHGDEEDFGPFQIDWLQQIGGKVDSVLRRIDRAATQVASGFGLGRGRGVMPAVVSATNRLMYRAGAHEKRLVRHAKALALDGIICGHFHLPALHDRGGRVYGNCGDWLDHFVALAEDPAGRLGLVFAEPKPAVAKAWAGWRLPAWARGRTA